MTVAEFPRSRLVRNQSATASGIRGIGTRAAYGQSSPRTTVVVVLLGAGSHATGRPARAPTTPTTAAPIRTATTLLLSASNPMAGAQRTTPCHACAISPPSTTVDPAIAPIAAGPAPS